MKKMIVFIKKKEGMSFEDFRNHYENVHVPLCGERIGHLIQEFRRYYPQNLNNLYHGRPDADAGHDSGTCYDAVAVYTIKDEAALQELIRIGQDPGFQRIITEDEERFCDRAATVEGFADEFFGSGLNG
ncbi:EthD domain-containing protein [Sphingobium tyrosinilyticum]|uniref:EthD domain-containing protein n=1 Tax=Sphingobium tyrosinilyticum TaxID=2715436 RepID=A0ABV9F1I3_9SPHN